MQEEYLVKRGVLEAKGGGYAKKSKNFKFEVKDSWLLWYEDEASTAVALTLPLLNATIEPDKKKDKKKPFRLTLASPDKKFKEVELNPDSQAEHDAWITAIQMGIRIASPMVFGLPISVAASKNQVGVPVIITKVIDFLQPHKDTEGIFRLSASQIEVQALKKHFDSGTIPEFAEKMDPAVPANLLKLFLRELPEPLMTFPLYNDFVGLASKAVPDRVREFPALLSQLPKVNKDTVFALIPFIHSVGLQHATNKMTFNNLAIVFGPTILRSANEALNVGGNTDYVTSVTETLIEHWHNIANPQQQQPAPQQTPSPSPVMPAPANPTPTPAPAPLPREPPAPLPRDKSMESVESVPPGNSVPAPKPKPTPPSKPDMRSSFDKGSPTARPMSSPTVGISATSTGRTSTVGSSSIETKLLQLEEQQKKNAELIQKISLSLGMI